MPDRRLTETGDVRLLETGDARLLETVAIAHATADTVTLTEALGRVKSTPIPKAVADTLALTETQRRQAAKLLAEGLTPSEALTAVAAGMVPFTDTLVIAPALDAALYRFRDIVRIVQDPFLDFTDTLTTVRALPEFLDVVRTVPPLRPLFDETIHRPVGRVEEV